MEEPKELEGLSLAQLQIARGPEIIIQHNFGLVNANGFDSRALRLRVLQQKMTWCSLCSKLQG